MAKIRVRLHSKDQPDYERGDEWLDADDSTMPVDIDDLPWEEVIAIERECGCTVPQVRRGSANHARLWMWTVRRAAGITESFQDFTPRPYGFEVFQLEQDQEAAEPVDADPPVPSPRTSAAASKPAKRSSTPTPRSRASTTSPRKKSGS